MHKMILSLFLIGTTQLFANQKQFDNCKETSLDKYHKIYQCGKEQYVVEYGVTNMGGEEVRKITLVSNGQAIIIKK